MERRKKIVILTAKTGGGHVSIANAIREHLEDRYDIVIYDPQPEIVNQHYKIITREAQWIWSAEYKTTNNEMTALLSHKVFTRVLTRKLKKCFALHNPDLIISTHPLLTYEVVQVLEDSGTPIPFAMIFTDPANIHWTWFIEKRADATFAPTMETYAQALDHEFDHKKLFYVGWPVRKQFKEIQAGKNEALLRSLHLDPSLFTIFMQGGGEGSTKFGLQLNALLDTDLPIQVILAAGSNKKLFEKFAHIPRVGIISFTPQLATYMATCDLVMGKAGPNVLFEAVTLGIPFLATTYLKGQERANIEFIARYGLGWTAFTYEEQIFLLRMLIQQRNLYTTKKESIIMYAKQNNEANKKIPEVIDSLLNSIVHPERKGAA